MFLEFGTPYVVKSVPIKEEPKFDLIRMVPTSDIVGVWLEGSNKQISGDQVSKGLGLAEKTESRQGKDAKLESMRTSTSLRGGGFVTPLGHVAK